MPYSPHMEKIATRAARVERQGGGLLQVMRRSRFGRPACGEIGAQPLGLRVGDAGARSLGTRNLFGRRNLLRTAHVDQRAALWVPRPLGVGQSEPGDVRAQTLAGELAGGLALDVGAAVLRGRAPSRQALVQVLLVHANRGSDGHAF